MRLYPLSLFLALLFMALGAGCAVHPPDDTSRQDLLREQWGIEVTGIRMSAAGHMVDFRYRVLDPDKARPLFRRDVKAYLIDEESGKVLSVPNMGKVGPLRTTDMPQKNRIYWMFFGNGGGLIHTGSRVTVVIGDFRAENLLVE